MNMVEQTLKSDELMNSLKKKFGNNFYTQPLCYEVCKYIKELIPEVEIIENFQVWKQDDKELDFIGNNGHYVIFYNDIIYDFTSDQYVTYGVKPANGLRILFPTFVDSDEFGSIINNMDWYKDNTNYLIAR